MNPKDQLIKLVKEMALKVKPEGEFFTLKSGQKSKFYLDCRRISLYSGGLSLISHLMFQKVLDEALIFEAIGGPCVGADPIVGGLLHRFGQHITDMRGFLIRPEVKDHGYESRIIGSVKPGDKILMIEDVITTGETVTDATKQIEDYGCQVIAYMAIIDRNPHGVIATIDGKPFYPLLTLKDLGIE